MDFPGLIGAFYSSFSTKAEIQTARNLQLERIESGAGRNQFALYRTPGLKFFPTAADPSKKTCRGLLELNDHLFRVQDDTIYDMLSDGSTNRSYGPILNDGLPCSMDYTTSSLFVVSAGTLYRANMGAITTPAAATVPLAAAVAVLNGTIIALDGSKSAAGVAGTNRFFYSQDDGQTWPASAFQTAAAYPNTVLNILVDHQELWLLGNRRTQVFVTGNDPNNPFDPVSGGIIEMGIAAPSAVARMDNSIFGFGRNKDGENIVWRANGYTPVRVSNHAVENAIRSYPEHRDAIMGTYQLNGHTCLRLTFPSANGGLGETWEYDASLPPELAWRNASFWNMQFGRYERHRGNAYASAFKKIYVGDYANGAFYEMSPDFNTDFGYPIRWERRTPHQAADGKQIAYRRFGLFMEKGEGTITPVWINDHSIPASTFAASVAALVPGTLSQVQANVLNAIYNYQTYNQDTALPDLTTLSLGFFDYGANPRVGLRWSNDGGKTFSGPFYRDMGRAGDYLKRTYWTRLGKGRDRVWEISGDSPVKTSIVQGVFDAQVLLS